LIARLRPLGTSRASLVDIAAELLHQTLPKVRGTPATDGNLSQPEINSRLGIKIWPITYKLQKSHCAKPTRIRNDM
jgi:hypothetical protein